jgi:hypothetical protein
MPYVGWARTDVAVSLGGLGPACWLASYPFALDSSRRNSDPVLDISDLALDCCFPGFDLVGLVTIIAVLKFSTRLLATGLLDSDASSWVAATPPTILCEIAAWAPTAMAAPPPRGPGPSQAVVQGGPLRQVSRLPAFILPKVPAMVFGGRKKSVVFDPVEIGLCRYFFRKCRRMYFKALLEMPPFTISCTFEYVAESFCRHFRKMP